MVGAEQLHSAIRLNASSRNLAILFGPAVGGGLMLCWDRRGASCQRADLPSVDDLPHPRALHRPRPAHRGASTARFGLTEAARLRRGALGSAHRDDDRPRRRHVVLRRQRLSGADAGVRARPGTDAAGVRYSALLAANAAGAVLGAVLLESTGLLRATTRTVIVCAGLWGVTMGLFPLATTYAVALTILVVAGVLNITFTSMAQAIVQIVARRRLAAASSACSTPPCSACGRGAGRDGRRARGAHQHPLVTGAERGRGRGDRRRSARARARG